MSFGKDSISHESIIDQKTKSMTHPLSFTFQIASAIQNSRGEPFTLIEHESRCKSIRRSLLLACERMRAFEEGSE